MSTPSTGSTNDVGALLRDMWSTRPWREPSDRILGGVSGALARRYAIDPTLVRVVFIVAAFFGIGFFLYLSLWAVLPNRADPGRTPVVVAVLAVLAGVLTFSGTSWSAPESVIGLVVAGGLLLLLHRSRAHLVATTPGASASVLAGTAPDPTPTGPPAADLPGADSGAHPGPGSTTVLASEAPYTGDPPTRGLAPPAPPSPGPRSRIVPITLAAALVAGGAVASLGMLGLLPTGATPVVGSALAVVGVGLVVGALRRTGRSLILVAVPLALILFTASESRTWVPIVGTGWPMFGVSPEARGPDGAYVSIDDGVWVPRSAAEVRPAYGSGVGDATLDLRAVAPGPPVETSVESGAGNVTVIVGGDADVTAYCSSGAGVVDCLGRPGGGPVADAGPDGPGGPEITVRARSGAGNVEVVRV